MIAALCIVLAVSLYVLTGWFWTVLSEGTLTGKDGLFNILLWPVTFAAEAAFYAKDKWQK